ncbi:PO113 protein, partial [Pelecanoides urinatrix]|nr:PO113 protein [Pelecanoides urinatrix]
GLVVAPEKIQQSAPWKYLGWTIEPAKIRPQKLTLKTPLKTLTDIQTVLGDIQWVRNCAGISNVDIKPLTELLCGTQPAAEILLKEEHYVALQHIVEKLSTAWTTRRILDLQISLLICNLVESPFAWIFLKVQPCTSIQMRPEAVSELIRKGRSRILELTGQEPADISIPVSAIDLEWWMRNSLPIQEALLGFDGVVHSRQPQGKLWQIIKRNQWLEKPKVVDKPIPEGITVYTDAGKRSKQAVCVWLEEGQWHKQPLTGQEGDTLQTLELTAVIWALEHWLDLPLNMVTDSLYVAGLVPRIQDALIKETSNSRLGKLFIQLRSVISQRTAPCAVIHIRSHQWDLGLGQGNQIADSLVSSVSHVPPADKFLQARQAHETFHQNAKGLRRQYGLSDNEARDIIQACPKCGNHGPGIGLGVNPRGLKALELWQMDVTHVAEFGRLKYVHVTIDTFSKAIWATALPGEKAHHVCKHLLACFAVLGVPEQIKTDNGPAYTSAKLRTFLMKWGVKHTTGIPYSPTGQGLVERTHQILK